MNLSINTKLNDWLTEQSITLNADQVKLLQGCIDFIIKHAESANDTNELLEKSLQLAIKSKQYQVSTKMTATLLCFPVISHLHEQNTLEKVLDQVDKNVMQLSKKLLKTIIIDEIATDSQHKLSIKQNQNLRRMLLSIVEDPRVIVIKLIECIYTLHSLKNKTEQAQQRYANQVMDIYAPLANRLGLGQIKWELEDIAFRYLDPTKYFDISKSLKLKRKERESTVELMTAALNDLIQQTNIKQGDINGRVKHIYSISKKMQRKGETFANIFDTTALRVLVPDVENCYEILGLIHSKWNNIADEFDDYISNPKPNGYQSIHTAILLEELGCVEIQIRTYQMHEESENGVAAHWKYKEKPSNTDQYQDKIQLLRQVIDWQKTVNSDNEEDNFSNVIADMIYVFSPQGQIYELTKDATPLDFAYRVHTDIGHRCRGAKINGKLVTLKNTLKNGDWVEIMTSKINRPSRDWLNPKSGYLASSQAINKVRHFFRKENYDENIKKGQEIWDKAHRQKKVARDKINETIKYFNLTSFQDLLAAIGSGEIGINTITNRTLQQAPAEPPKSIVKPTKVKKTNPNRIYIDGVSGLLNQIAKCCNPIPGDDIVGYITKEKGISIHKKSCKNINHQAEQCQERIINASWGDLEEYFVINLRLECFDKKGLIHDISNKIVKHDCKLLSLNTKVIETNYIALIDMQLQVKSTDQYQKIKHDLNTLSSIIEISRI
jgi:GTP pyrophosphokinase